MPAAFAALGDDCIDAPLGHLFGVTPGSDGGHHDQTGRAAPVDEGGVRCLGEAGHPNAVVDHQGHPVADVGDVGAHVDAERGIGLGTHLGDLCGELLERHRGRGQDAKATRLGGGTDEA